jgi:hypothetical protein
MEKSEVFHTQDEELRDFSWIEKIAEIAVSEVKLSQAEIDEPHEFYGFGD